MPALKGAEIPPGNWVRKHPLGVMPRSTRPCRGCGTLLAQVLVDWGEEFHVCCGPDRRPMALRLVPDERR